MNKIFILYLFLSNLLAFNNTECLEFMNYSPNEQMLIMDKVKEVALGPGKIEVRHRYFKDNDGKYDDVSRIFEKLENISNCFENRIDSLNAYISKAYIGRLYFKTGNFHMAEEEIKKINKWLELVQYTGLEEKKIGTIKNLVQSLQSEFMQDKGDYKAKYAPMIIRFKKSELGPRTVSNMGSLVREKDGKELKFELLLPDNGKNVFNDPVKIKRYKYLKEKKTEIIFDNEYYNEDGNLSYEMKIKYVPVLRHEKDGKRDYYYTLMITDELNNKIFRYLTRFDRDTYSEPIEIDYSINWAVKLSAAQGMISLYLPSNSSEYSLSIQDYNDNDIESISSKGKYDIYRLPSLIADDYEYQLIYESNNQRTDIKMTKTSVFNIGLLLLSTFLIINQMDIY